MGYVKDIYLRIGAVLGLVLIGAWFVYTRTTFALSYGTQGTGLRTMAEVQGLCDSSAGQLARTLSAQGSAACGSVDHAATLWNAAGFAGLLLAVACAAVLLYRGVQRTGAAAA